MGPIREITLDQLLAPRATWTPGTQPRLSEKDFDHLSAMCRQMAAYYPHQEMASETVQGYLHEFEGLAVRYGAEGLESACRVLRSKAGQKFFPHPSEVAEQIEQQVEANKEVLARKMQDLRAQGEREEDIETFWNEVLPDRMERYGWTEEEALRRFPSFKGTKPVQNTAAKPNVVTMPKQVCKQSTAAILKGKRDSSDRVLSHPIKRPERENQ